MISGAAKDSDPHRVWSMGEEGLMNLDSPKSVSLTKGVGNESMGMLPVVGGASLNGLTVRRISVVSPCSCAYQERVGKRWGLSSSPQDDSLSSLMSRCTTPTSCSHPIPLHNSPNNRRTIASPSSLPGPFAIILLLFSSSDIKLKSSPPDNRSKTKQ